MPHSLLSKANTLRSSEGEEDSGTASCDSDVPVIVESSPSVPQVWEVNDCLARRDLRRYKQLHHLSELHRGADLPCTPLVSAYLCRCNRLISIWKAISICLPSPNLRRFSTVSDVQPSGCQPRLFCLDISRICWGRSGGRRPSPATLSSPILGCKQLSGDEWHVGMGVVGYSRLHGCDLWSMQKINPRTPSI